MPTFQHISHNDTQCPVHYLAGNHHKMMGDPSRRSNCSTNVVGVRTHLTMVLCLLKVLVLVTLKLSHNYVTLIDGLVSQLRSKH